MNSTPSATRRTLLAGAAAAALLPSSALIATIAAAEDMNPSRQRPQAGDSLVFADGSRANQTVLAEHIVAGAAPITAWPADAATQHTRDGSRLNLVRVLRVASAALSARALECAADGIVAYASMCTHAGCDVSGWDDATQHLKCPCHGSEFDALDAAAIVKGPATRPLAMLPLRIENARLVVAAGFTRQVGFKAL